MNSPEGSPGTTIHFGDVVRMEHVSPTGEAQYSEPGVVIDVNGASLSMAQLLS